MPDLDELATNLAELGPPTSPVKAPRSCQDRSWAPTWTVVPEKIFTASANAVKVGMTANTVSALTGEGRRRAHAATRAHQARVSA